MNKIEIPAGGEKAVIVAATAGYLFGVTVMFAVSIKELRESDRARKRANSFASRLVDEAWVYLPPEVKDKFQNEIRFFNISEQENL